MLIVFKINMAELTAGSTITYLTEEQKKEALSGFSFNQTGQLIEPLKLPPLGVTK